MVVSLSHVEKEERRIYNEKMERDSSKIRCVIYDCDGVPTLLVLKGGRIAAKKTGLMNVREMTEFYRSA